MNHKDVETMKSLLEKERTEFKESLLNDCSMPEDIMGVINDHPNDHIIKNLFSRETIKRAQTVGYLIHATNSIEDLNEDIASTECGCGESGCSNYNPSTDLDKLMKPMVKNNHTDLLGESAAEGCF